jgi:hypothetical protein
MPKTGAETYDDFWAHKPSGQLIYEPTRELWVPASVNATLPRIPLVGKNGKPVLNKRTGEPKTIPASVYLARNKPVQQMTWAPGEGTIIRDRLIAEGGWIKREHAACFNLYRPAPAITGNKKDIGPWLKHVQKIYPAEAKHIIRWCAQRVQQPQVKLNHALVLGGAQGIGKDSALEPVKHAIGHWNFAEVGPQQVLGRFNGFLKKIVLRVNEARDLGEVNRYQFYDHMKTYMVAPPDVLRVDEKNLREHYILNVVGIIITTNYKTDGLFLPPDDRRHFVAWSELTKDDFSPTYWRTLWGWYYNKGGLANVAAYLAALDLSDFDPKAPPPKTAAWWAIVDANRAPEEAELADVLDHLKNPDAVTLEQIKDATNFHGDFYKWLDDHRNRRAIPHRLEQAGYVPVRNTARKSASGVWVLGGKRQVVYAKKDLALSGQLKAASALKHRADAEQAQKQAEYAATRPMPRSAATAKTPAKSKQNGRSRGVRF